jgi:exopolysaccharide production protein ExoQ
MSAKLALIAHFLLIAAFLWVEWRRRPGVSGALWIPVAWVVIFASRPVSAWLNLQGGGVAIDEMEGNSTDRNFFLFLIFAAIFVLSRRSINWNALIENNRWLVLLYAYLGISILWSDYSFVSLKRWIKDFGNVLMVLVMLTDPRPLEAVKTLFARAAFFLIPVSVLFIKYFPEFGRGFNELTGQMYFHGATRGKNELGATILVLTLFNAWKLAQLLRQGGWKFRRTEVLVQVLLMVMALYLFRMARSATSLACVMVGAAAITALNMDFVRQRLKGLLNLCMVAGVFLMLLSTVVDLKGNIAIMLGRDPTLHGRTGVWENVLGEKTNPLIGTGYSSFWLGGRAAKISARQGYTVHLNQAHNGYLEMYLNGGAIGVFLLIGLLASTMRRLSRQMLVDPDWSGLKLVLCGIVMIYNWSEDAFFRSGPLWFATIVACVNYGRVIGVNTAAKPELKAAA